MTTLNRFAAIAALAMTPLLAQADNPRAVSQQNRAFEAQSDLGTPGGLNLDWFRRNAILNEGQVTTSYNAILASPNSSLREAQQGVNVEIQSRLWGFCADYGERRDGRCMSPYSEDGSRAYTPARNQDHGQLFPFEITARLEMQPGQNTRALLQNLRVGFGRLIWNSVGITLQGASYVYKDRLFGQGSSHMFELAQVSVNEVVRLDRNGAVAVVFKGYARAGFGTFRNSEGAADRQIVAMAPDAEPASRSSTFGVWLQTGASVGLRLVDRILASVLVDYEVQNGAGGHGERTSTGSLTRAGSFDREIRNTTVGGSLRMQITPALAATLYLQRAFIGQDTWFDFKTTGRTGALDYRDDYYVDSFRGHQDTAPIEGGAVFEVRY